MDYGRMGKISGFVSGGGGGGGSDVDDKVFTEIPYNAITIYINHPNLDIGYIHLVNGGHPVIDINLVGYPGKILTLLLIQGSAGNSLVSFSGIFRFPTCLPSPVLTPVPNATDYITFMHNYASNLYDCIGFVNGFTV